MKIEKFSISNDPERYEAWPDVALCPSGRLVCVFNECKHHADRSYTRIMLSDSTDGGRTWSPKRPLTEGTSGLPYSYNCPRLTMLADGRLAACVDRVPACGESKAAEAVVCLYFSEDEGRHWSAAVETPCRGIVPDRLTVSDGRWLLASHYPMAGGLGEVLRYSDDEGRSWSEPVVVAYEKGLQLCEASLLPLGEGRIAAFLRENSGRGLDCQKVVSLDNGASWSPLVSFPLPGCHRPVAGRLADGRVLITYRFMQGGKGWLGAWTQNLFGAVATEEAALARRRCDASTRIFPIDYDASPFSDIGYSGWVQLPDGIVYVVNYLVDDAYDKGQIRGYRIDPAEIVIAPRG